jgi:TRAP-type C4-dicarboxylate transport system permease small subunit
VEKAYAIWRAFQDRILGRVAALLLLGCTLIALVEIFRRYVLGYSFEWQQDAVTFFTLSGVFLYFSLCQRHRVHLTVTLVPELLALAGPRGRVAGEIVVLCALAFSLLFLCAVVWWGIPEIEDGFKYESRTESLAFPMWPFLLALLLGFAFMAVTMAFQLYFGIRKLLGHSVPEEEDADFDRSAH